jgi:hypothetical protein
MSAASLSAARRRLRRNLLPRFETAVRPAAAFCMISLGSIVQRLSGLPTVFDYASSTNERALARAARAQKSIETVSQTERCNITGGEPAAALAPRT